MSGNEEGGKLNLNLGAKVFIPKSLQTNQTQNTNLNSQVNQGGYNPYTINSQIDYNNMNLMNSQTGNMNINQNTIGYNPYMMNNYNQIGLNNNFSNLNQMTIDPNLTKNIPNNNSDINKSNNQNNKATKKVEEVKKQIITNKDQKPQQQQQPIKKTEKKKEEKKDEKKVEKKEEEVIDDIELISDSKEGKMTEVDKTREPCSIVFLGHVDHGKSTVAGNILIKTGMVDERTLEKYQKEAKIKNRESWYLAYILDINEEEREKGKTVEIGKAFFKTEKKRFTLLDAPGHSGFLPNLLQGACQADFAGLVISAKAGEFEAGFEKSGSTREHILLAKSLGVSRLVVMVNKMDETTVNWSEKRFNQITSDLGDYFKKIGYTKEDVIYVPISGLYGDNLITKVSNDKCPWYEGNCLLEVFNNLESPKRDINGPLRISILDRYKEGGMQLMGKVESGTIHYGKSYIVMPTKIPIEVQWIFNSEDEGVPYACPGESVRVIFLY